MEAEMDPNQEGGQCVVVGHQTSMGRCFSEKTDLGYRDACLVTSDLNQRSSLDGCDQCAEGLLHVTDKDLEAALRCNSGLDG